MTHNIPDDITNYFNVEFFTAIAQNLDEPVPAISKAVSAIIPTALEALVDQPAASGNFYQLAKEAAQYYSKAPDVARLVNEEKGSNLHRDIFGNNERAVGRHIAAYSEVRPTTPDLSHEVTSSKEDLEKIHEANVGRNKTNFVFPKWVPILIVAVVVLMLIYFSRQ